MAAGALLAASSWEIVVLIYVTIAPVSSPPNAEVVRRTAWAKNVEVMDVVARAGRALLVCLVMHLGSAVQVARPIVPSKNAAITDVVVPVEHVPSDSTAMHSENVFRIVSQTVSANHVEVMDVVVPAASALLVKVVTT